MDRVGGGMRWWGRRRCVRRRITVDGGDGTPTIELGLRGGRISIDRTYRRSGGGGWRQCGVTRRWGQHG
jgi:hypothetical protein